MTAQTCTERAADFLLNLECVGTVAQREAIMMEVVESGGTYIVPNGDDWSSHLFEISLHDVFASGPTEDEAIRNWKRAARAMLASVEDDGFITVYPPFPNPRNHAEEIENVRAEAAQDAAE